MAMTSRPSTNPPSKISSESLPETEASSRSHSLADRIASCALDHYHKQLTKKAKPKPGQEWTVFAAIVVFHRIDDRMWVVSSATGTKCTAQRHNEFILHDSHAEVLARRGFIRILFDEIRERELGNTDEAKNDVGENIRYLLVESMNCSDEDIKQQQSITRVKKYQLNPDIGIHLYISDSPCGDASIYGIPSGSSGSETDNNNNNEILYTGAKVIVSKATKVDATDCGGEHQLLSTENSTGEKGKEDGNAMVETVATGPIVAREEVQSLGKLRTKSGRSNLPAHMRSHSHSCSDKIVLWSVLGLQGAMLTKYLNPPVVPLTSVVVSIDSRLLVEKSSTHNQVKMQDRQQQIALKRAIPDRVTKVWEQQDKLPAWRPPVPTVHIVSKVYESGKAAMIATSEAKQLSGKKRKHSESNTEHECSGKNREYGDIETNKTPTKPKNVPPCGMSFNWNQKDGLEVLVGSRGIKHGKKPKRPEDIEKLASRLSRARLMRDFSFRSERIFTSGATQEKKSRCDVPKSQNNAPPSSLSQDGRGYYQMKSNAANSEWCNLKTRILTQNGSPLAGWLRCVKVDDDFTVHGRHKNNE